MSDHAVEQSKDGIFWMSWQDFQIHFRSIYVCRIYPPEMRYSLRGQWRGYSAGGCQDYDTWHQNPQFHLRATGPDASFPIHVFITLTQVYSMMYLQGNLFLYIYISFFFLFIDKQTEHLLIKSAKKRGPFIYKSIINWIL